MAVADDSAGADPKNIMAVDVGSIEQIKAEDLGTSVDISHDPTTGQSCVSHLDQSVDLSRAYSTERQLASTSLGCIDQTRPQNESNAGAQISSSGSLSVNSIPDVSSLSSLCDDADMSAQFSSVEPSPAVQPTLADPSNDKIGIEESKAIDGIVSSVTDFTPDVITDTAPTANSVASTSPPQAVPMVAAVPANPFKTPFYRVVTDGSRRQKHTKVSRIASDILEGLFGDGKIMPVPPQYSCVALARYPQIEISVYTDIGGRRTQEDRFTYCPCVGGRKDVFFAGIFDGTVGDFASDTVKELVIPHLVNSSPWPQIVSLLDSKKGSNVPQESAETSPHKDVNSQLFPLLAEAVDEMYLSADSELVDTCALRSLHYASSTSVVTLLAGDCCCIGHLGDSRAALGHFCDAHLYANFITDDHKPNQPHERLRIRQSGGSVEYLHNHNNKPFIRGGDFTQRKSRGEQPMQLQYSRAFGGKDLKMFGLSNEPDVLCFKIEQFHSCLILASDGVWDVLTAGAAVKVVVKARLSNKDPAAALVNTVLSEQAVRRQASDNVTAIVIFFATECNNTIWESAWPEDRAAHEPICLDPREEV